MPAGCYRWILYAENFFNYFNDLFEKLNYLSIKDVPYE